MDVSLEAGGRAGRIVEERFAAVDESDLGCREVGRDVGGVLDAGSATANDEDVVGLAQRLVAVFEVLDNVVGCTSSRW